MKLAELLTLAACLSWAGYALAADEAPFDFTQPESPRRETPDWVKMFDQGKNNDKLKGYFTPTGVKLEIVADYPTVVNPIGMAFSRDGVAHVIEWTRGKDPSVADERRTITYKDGTKREILVLKKADKDVIKRLVFNKENGIYDKATVILEDEFPSGMLFHDGWLYVAGQGSVRRYRQSKADGPFDVRQVVAQGFAGYGRNQVSGLTIGNDGCLYITCGSGDNHVEATDGSLATVLGSGAVFRCQLDATGGSKIEVYASGFCNPRGNVAFDADFNMFHTDAGTEDGTKFQGCRLMHVVETGDYGWRSLPGSRENRPDPVLGAVFGELPGRLPPMIKTGRGSPSGPMIYDDDRFPERFRGPIYYPDPQRHSIRAYELKAIGASFTVAKEFELLKSDDPLFQPCQMLTGPDGAIYVVDRRSTTHPDSLWGDGEHGRIYRLSWQGADEMPALEPRALDCRAGLRTSVEDDLFKALDSEVPSERFAAQFELARRGEKERKPLLQLLADGKKSTEARTAALGALQSLWNTDVQSAVSKLFKDEPSVLSRLAADALALHAKVGNKDVHAALLEALADGDPGVRRSVALALGRIQGPGAYDHLAGAFSFDDGKDPFISDAYLRALERGGTDGLERLLALGDSGDQKLTDRVADAFLAMRSPAAAKLIPQLLRSPHLNTSERAAILRSCANYRTHPPIDFAALIEYLEKEADDEAELKLAGVEALAHRASVKADAATPLLLKYLKDDDARVRAASIEAVAQMRVAKASGELAKAMLDDSRTTTERVAAARTLGLLGDTGDKAVASALKELVDPKTKTPAAGLLRAEALHTLALIDTDAAQAAAKDLLEDLSRDVQAEAIRTLGTTAKGARIVGERATTVEFARYLMPAAIEVLERHAADAEVAKQLATVTKEGLKIGTDKKSLEALQGLVNGKPNEKRGRSAFIECGCANCHRLAGLGRGLAPDLTGMTLTSPFEKLVNMIAEPSSDIRPDFRAFTATTKKGQTYSGLRISQTADEIILREVTGRDVRLLTKDISELAPSKKPFMSRHACSPLAMEEFADLLAFLTNAKSQEALRGIVHEFNVIGPFAGKVDDAQPVDQKPDPDAAYKDDKGNKLRWQTIETDPNGMLDLRGVFSKRDASAYALTYVYSPKAQKVPLKFGAGCSARVWLNDEMIHEQVDARIPQPDKKTINVELQEGWNVVLVKVTSCAICHGLYLRFDGGDGLKVARRPDAK